MVPIEQLSNGQLEEYGRERKKSTKRLFVSYATIRQSKGLFRLRSGDLPSTSSQKMQASDT
jgi:hypothetical protein